RNGDGSGVSAIYWKDLESIAAFARDREHIVAKRKGREIWYPHYMIRICKVERDYGRPDWPRNQNRYAHASPPPSAARLRYSPRPMRNVALSGITRSGHVAEDSAA